MRLLMESRAQENVLAERNTLQQKICELEQRVDENKILVRELADSLAKSERGAVKTMPKQGSISELSDEALHVRG